MKVILFDVDDTLFDFNACAKIALEKTFVDYQLHYEPSVFTLFKTIDDQLWHDFEKGTIDKKTVLLQRFIRLLEQLQLPPIEGISSTFQHHLSKTYIFIEGAKDVLEQLYQRYDLYVVTNASSATQRYRLKKAGIEHYFKKLFISEEVGYRKPQKAFFEVCLQDVGDIPYDDILIVGDSLTSDILGGKRAGIQTCWFNPSYQIAQDKIYDIEIHHLNELLEVLEK